MNTTQKVFPLTDDLMQIAAGLATRAILLGADEEKAVLAAVVLLRIDDRDATRLATMVLELTRWFNRQALPEMRAEMLRDFLARAQPQGRA